MTVRVRHLERIALDVYWDPKVFARVRRHYLDYIDRRGTGRRGYAHWLNTVIADGINTDARPAVDPRPVINIECHYEPQWDPRVLDAMRHYWATVLAPLPAYQGATVNLWINELAVAALDALEPTKAAQLHLPGIPVASPRWRRQARFPLGESDRRGF